MPPPLPTDNVVAWDSTLNRYVPSGQAALPGFAAIIDTVLADIAAESPGALPLAGATNLAADAGHRHGGIPGSINQLVNGGFEVWQRGNGPYTVNNSYSADRWMQINAGTDTLSIARDTTNADVGSQVCAACTFVLGTGGGASQLQQILKGSDGYQVGNANGTTTISFSVRIKTAVANGARPYVYDGATITYGAFHVGDGLYHTQTISMVTRVNPTLWQAGVFFAATGTYYIDNAMLVTGSVAADFTPLPPADDLARCLRYYELIGGSANEALASLMCGSTTLAYGMLRWKARKAVVPTITIATPTNFYVWLANTVTQATTGVSAGSPSPDAATVNVSVASGLAGGNASILFSNAGATLVIEANP